MIYRYKDF